MTGLTIQTGRDLTVSVAAVLIALGTIYRYMVRPVVGAFKRVEDTTRYIEAEWQVTEKGRKARVYRLTKTGRKRLEKIEQSWTTLTEGVRRVLKWA